jgi:glucan phosphoethanolaminetransferase (alkaline phosphatase superfamily)
MAILIFNIMFYLFGLALAIIPLILSSKKNVGKSKPMWYKISIPVIIVVLIIMGIIKTKIDYNSQIKSSDAMTGLTNKVSNLVASHKNDSASFAQFLWRLKPIGIKRDTLTNKPVVDKSVYITYIKSISGSNLYFGDH